VVDYQVKTIQLFKHIFQLIKVLLADTTGTKVQCNTEVFDTDGICYDNSTNYRFTPLVAGKYFVHSNVFG
jgi:hypothetical protein